MQKIHSVFLNQIKSNQVQFAVDKLNLLRKFAMLWSMHRYPLEE